MNWKPIKNIHFLNYFYFSFNSLYTFIFSVASCFTPATFSSTSPFARAFFFLALTLSFSLNLSRSLSYLRVFCIKYYVHLPRLRMHSLRVAKSGRSKIWRQFLIHSHTWHFAHSLSRSQCIIFISLSHTATHMFPVFFLLSNARLSVLFPQITIARIVFT